MTSSGFGEGALGRLAGGELDDLQVLLLELGAQLQIGGGDDDRLGRRVHLLHRLVLHEVVGAVRQPASGENGNGKDGKDSVAHVWSPSYSFRITRGAHGQRSLPDGRKRSDEPRNRTEDHEVERIVDSDPRRGDCRRTATLRTTLIGRRRGVRQAAAGHVVAHGSWSPARRCSR